MENTIGAKIYEEHNRYQNMENIKGVKTYGEDNRFQNIWRTL